MAPNAVLSRSSVGAPQTRLKASVTGTPCTMRKDAFSKPTTPRKSARSMFAWSKMESVMVAPRKDVPNRFAFANSASTRCAYGKRGGGSLTTRRSIAWGPTAHFLARPQCAFDQSRLFLGQRPCTSAISRSRLGLVSPSRSQTRRRKRLGRPRPPGRRPRGRSSWR